MLLSEAIKMSDAMRICPAYLWEDELDFELLIRGNEVMLKTLDEKKDLLSEHLSDPPLRSKVETLNPLTEFKVCSRKIEEVEYLYNELRETSEPALRLPTLFVHVCLRIKLSMFRSNLNFEDFMTLAKRAVVMGAKLESLYACKFPSIAISRSSVEDIEEEFKTMTLRRKRLGQYLSESEEENSSVKEKKVKQRTEPQTHSPKEKSHLPRGGRK